MSEKIQIHKQDGCYNCAYCTSIDTTPHHRRRYCHRPEHAGKHGAPHQVNTADICELWSQRVGGVANKGSGAR
jgi:hypothetical protein